MAVNLKGKSFLTLMDFSPLEIRYMLDLSHDLKSKKRAGIYNDLLKGKSILLLFEKSSTRTRCAFEVAALEEGAHVTFLDSGSSQFGKKNPWKTAQKYWADFMMVLNTEVSNKKLLKTLLNTPAYLYGTV